MITRASAVPVDNPVLAFPRETVSSAYPVRIQYAVALSQDVSFGVVSYSRCTEPGLQSALDPPSVLETRKLPAADCGLTFTYGSGARLGGLDTTVPPQQSVLVNVLCAYAVPDEARARTVRHPTQNSKLDRH